MLPMDSDNRFKVAGDSSHLRVSWQVSGIHQDSWMKSHRIPVEEEKSSVEQETYLYPLEGYIFPMTAELRRNTCSSVISWCSQCTRQLDRQTWTQNPPAGCYRIRSDGKTTALSCPSVDTAATPKK